MNQNPLVPAKAGTHGGLLVRIELDSRLRGNERAIVARTDVCGSSALRVSPPYARYVCSSTTARVRRTHDFVDHSAPPDDANAGKMFVIIKSSGVNSHELGRDYSV